MLAMVASSTTISCAMEIRTRAQVRLSSRWGGVTAPAGGVALVVSVIGVLRWWLGLSEQRGPTVRRTVGWNQWSVMSQGVSQAVAEQGVDRGRAVRRGGSPRRAPA